MKKFFLAGTAMSLLAAGMILTSCDTESNLDVSNPEQEALDINWAAKFGDIDPAQDWVLADTANAVISVYGLNALSTYQLQLYTENPISADNALLMASKPVKTDASGTACANFVVDLIKGHTTFYACYVDGDNRRYVKPVALIGDVITAQFGLPSTSNAKPRKASSSSNGLSIPSVSNPKSEVMAKENQAKEVNNQNKDQNSDGSPDYASVMKISKGNTWNGNINVLGSEGNSARTLYVYGTWQLNGQQKLGGSGLVVVCDGGKVKIPSGSSLQSDNGGRIVVLPGGSVEGDGNITFCNGSNSSYDYNAGTITIGTMNNNGGRVFNYGTLNITELQGGSGNSTYINHNVMNIDHSTYGLNSANVRILTDCQVNVKNDLCCKIIKMGNPSYVHVGGNLRMSVSYDGTNDAAEIVMAQNSHLSVNGGIALNNASIVGPTNGYALCEFGQIGDPDNIVATNYTTSWNSGSEQVTEGYVINNLYISIDKTEKIDNYWNLTPYGKFTLIMMNGRLYDVKQDASNNWANYPAYRDNAHVGNGNAVIVAKGQADLYIPETECDDVYTSPGKSPAYNGAKSTPTETNGQGFIIACEDLGSTNDVDYNDVVFSVSHVAGQKYITVTPLAAGGTLEAEIYYGNQPVGEIHSMLGVTDTKQMINTRSQKITAKGDPTTIEVPEDWTFPSNSKKFSIHVTNNENVSKLIEAPEEGTAPFMIVVPSDWCWPLEKVNIEEAYPNFRDWSQDAATNDKWCTPIAGKVVVR